MTDFPVRKLRVTAIEKLASLPNGADLYDVKVATEDGEVPEGPFRAFVELEVGELLEFEVRPFNRPGYDRTFTLLPQGRESRTRRVQRQMKDLEQRVNEIENTLDARVRKIVEDTLEEKALEQAL